MFHIWIELSSSVCQHCQLAALCMLYYKSLLIVSKSGTAVAMSRAVGGSQCVNIGISPMITSMKSTHESVPFKHSVGRLYIGTLC